MSDFWNFHVHSDYSVLDGYQKLNEMVEFTISNQQKALALTDHGTMGGYWKFYKKCREHNIKPVIGIEFYTYHEGQTKRRHITVVAKNWQGLQSIFKLTSISVRKPYRGKPTIELDDILEHGKDIIVGSGCMGSDFNVLIREEKYEAIDLMMDFKEKFKDDFYIELHLNKLKEQKELNHQLYEIANEFNIPIMLGSDAHYSYPADAEYHRKFMQIQTNNRFEFDSNDFYMKTYEQAVEILKWQGFTKKQIKQIMNSHNNVLEKINVEIPEFKNTLPTPYSDEDENKKLWELVEKGAKVRGIWNKKQYRDKIKYEMEYIENLGFVRYFLVVYDMLEWCRKNNIWYGVGRGSAGASVVSYSLFITHIDPIQWDLMFHRFISPNRVSYPDIDLDFEDENRDKVIEYLINKYGKEQTARIVTFITMKGKQALRDAGRVLKIPMFHVNKATAKVITRSTGDARADACVADTFEDFEELKPLKYKYPEWIDLATHLEGRIKSKGKHAAGLLVVNDAIWKFTALDYYGEKTTSLEYRDLDEQNLVKFDLLGLNTITKIKKVCELIGKEFDWIFKIPLDDDETLKLYTSGDLTGIFQFESEGFANFVKQIRVSIEFKDLVALNALYRPSGLRNGIANDYVACLNGDKKPIKLHPIYDNITKETFGVIVYQEQVMRLFGEMAGFDPITVDTMRKTIAKSHGVQAVEVARKDFIAGSVKNGVDEKVAEEIFELIKFFGLYGFNKSHAVSYTLLSYITAYLKKHYTLNFFVGWLNAENQKDEISKLLEDAEKHKIKILPPKLNKSDVGFTIEDGAIRCGMKWVEYIGEKSAEKIVLSRKRGGKFNSYRELKERNVANKRQIQILATIKALEDETDEDLLVQYYPYPQVERKMRMLNKELKEKKLDKKYDYVTLEKVIEKSGEIVVKGIITNVIINKIGDFPWDDVKRWGLGRMYATIFLSDGNGMIRIKLNPDQYDKHKNNLFIGSKGIFKVKAYKKSSVQWKGVKWFNNHSDVVNSLVEVDLRSDKEKRKDLVKKAQKTLF